jgi:hypothetical protein
MNPPSRKMRIEAAYHAFMHEAAAHEREGRLRQAWTSLECAHVLGQSTTSLHVRSHIAMLGLAWRTRVWREVIGQIFRTFGAIVATWIWVPTGNTGRADVSAFRKMPIPDDLRKLMAD